MNENDFLSEKSKSGLQDDYVIEINEMTEKNAAKEEREKETCQNCGNFFSPEDDYVTLCSRCRHELLGI